MLVYLMCICLLACFIMLINIPAPGGSVGYAFLAHKAIFGSINETIYECKVFP